MISVSHRVVLHHETQLGSTNNIGRMVLYIHHAEIRFRVKTIEILVLEQVCLRWSGKHFWQKNPCKKSADLHPRQGNKLPWNKGTFYRAQRNLSLQHKTRRVFIVKSSLQNAFRAIFF
jgi:hypothetical protein